MKKTMRPPGSKCTKDAYEDTENPQEPPQNPRKAPQNPQEPHPPLQPPTAAQLETAKTKMRRRAMSRWPPGSACTTDGYEEIVMPCVRVRRTAAAKRRQRKNRNEPEKLAIANFRRKLRRASHAAARRGA